MLALPALSHQTGRTLVTVSCRGTECFLRVPPTRQVGQSSLSHACVLLWRGGEEVCVWCGGRWENCVNVVVLGGDVEEGRRESGGYGVRSRLSPVVTKAWHKQYPRADEGLAKRAPTTLGTTKTGPPAVWCARLLFASGPSANTVRRTHTFQSHPFIAARCCMLL